jgi:hypothetical protein
VAFKAEGRFELCVDIESFLAAGHHKCCSDRNDGKLTSFQPTSM